MLENFNLLFSEKKINNFCFAIHKNMIFYESKNNNISNFVFLIKKKVKRELLSENIINNIIIQINNDEGYYVVGLEMESFKNLDKKENKIKYISERLKNFSLIG